MQLYDVTFNGRNLNDIVGSFVSYHDFNEQPERDVALRSLARANKSVTVGAFFTSKTIPISLFVNGCTRTRAEAIYNTLRQLTQEPNRDLVVTVQGQPDDSGEYTSRTITYRESTLNQVTIDWDAGTAIVQLEFISADPMGYGEEQAIYSGVLESANTSIPLVVEGTFNRQLPIISVTYSQETPVAPLSILTGSSFFSASLGDIDVINAGDVITIDSAEGSIKVNDYSIDYDGILPRLSPPSDAITFVGPYSAGATINIINSPRYI